MVLRRSDSVGGRGAKRALGTRLSELARVGRTDNMNKRQRDALNVVKICVKKVRCKQAVRKGLGELLASGTKNAGPVLLAEYVAERTGIKVKSPQFLGKTNPVWKASGDGSASTKPFELRHAAKMTFCHRVTKQQIKGLVAEDPLVKQTRLFLKAVEPAKMPFWFLLAVVCTGFATRCLPWLVHATEFLKRGSWSTPKPKLWKIIIN